MNMDLKVVQVVQAQNKGAVTFSDAEAGKPATVTVTIAFDDAKKVGTYVYGAVYNITDTFLTAL